MRSELAALDHLAQGGERLYARPLLALATLPNPNPQRSVPPSQGCLHLSRTSLTTSRSSARSIQARRLLPRDIFQSKGGRAAMRILEVPYRVIKQAATMRGKLEDRGKGWKLLKTSLDGCAAQFPLLASLVLFRPAVHLPKEVGFGENDPVGNILLCEMGTARPLRRWTATKHGRYNERFYHKEPVMPTKAVRAPWALLGGSNIGQGTRQDTERICLTAVPMM